MKEALTIVLCLLMITVVNAGELMYVGDGQNSRIYIDPSTIVRDGDSRKVVMYQNLFERDEYGSMSMVMLTEYKCKSKLRRIIEISAYSLPNGLGKRIASETATPWVTTPKNSPADVVLGLICNSQK